MEFLTHGKTVETGRDAVIPNASVMSEPIGDCAAEDTRFPLTFSRWRSGVISST
jgi:hypothetical protein